MICWIEPASRPAAVGPEMRDDPSNAATLETTMNVLVVGPHPDDQELAMGGTILRLLADGHHVRLLDLTDGEPTPHGSPEIRAREAARAAEILGVERIMLGRDHGFVNREVVHTIAARHAVAGVLRVHEIDWIFCPHPVDAHPDHRAATRIVEDARFDAKLTKTDIPGEPRHPSRLVHYYATHLKTIPQPSFLVDTTGFHDRKMEAVLAYESQFRTHEKNRAVVAWLDAQARFLGSRIGVETAEPFSVLEPLGVRGFGGLV